MPKPSSKPNFTCMYISVCQSQILKEQPITGNPEISKLIEKFADIGLKIFKGKGQKKIVLKNVFKYL